ncbi:aldo/keto reductase [Radiobacillus deserti]|uniref:Aldo/keto reductase n=1 Tax=Radiobacillus deserti TaxID=2594883 RepID=A0A516KGL3_9BACI|nr:aldo/keto reductase [Radiobacillus deserti]QDP40532.1 aldo/keto reductase [Radiobacillus deserti]
MKKNQLGTSELFVSEVALGCMSLGTDEQKAKAVIDEALEQGINYLDTADLYDKGLNEEIVGKAIKDRRQDIVLATKVGNHLKEDGTWYWDPSKEYIKNQVKESLRRLGTDYIDLYQLHGGTIEDPIDETIEAFEELTKEGTVRYYGISSIRPNVIRTYVEKSNIVSVMMQYSLLDRRPEEEVLDLLHQHSISVVARGPMGKGMLANHGKEIVQAKGQKGYLDYSYDELVGIIEELQSFDQPASSLAIRYVLHHPAVASAVFGASSVEQLVENLTYQDIRVTENEVQRLQQITKPIVYQQHR